MSYVIVYYIALYCIIGGAPFGQRLAASNFPASAKWVLTTACEVRKTKHVLYYIIFKLLFKCIIVYCIVLY